MTFPCKGWIPDHCLSKLSTSLTDVLTVKFRVSPTCSAHTEGNEDQARKGRRDNICLQKPPVQAGKRKHTSAPVQRTNREDVFAQHSKNCAPQNRCTGKNCVTTRTCGRPSVRVRCHCTDAIKHFPHAFARCVFDLTSHLAGHVTTLYLVECGSVRTDN